jgi:hypothetical protein
MKCLIGRDLLQDISKIIPKFYENIIEEEEMVKDLPMPPLDDEDDFLLRDAQMSTVGGECKHCFNLQYCKI